MADKARTSETPPTLLARLSWQAEHLAAQSQYCSRGTRSASVRSCSVWAPGRMATAASSARSRSKRPSTSAWPRACAWNLQIGACSLQVRGLKDCYGRL